MDLHLVTPKGQELFHALPLALLNMGGLLDFVENGLVRASGPNGRGLLLIYDKDITAATWQETNGRVHSGEAAIKLWDNLGGEVRLAAETLDKGVVRVLPILWSDIPASPRIKIGHLADLAAFISDQVRNEHKEQMVAVTLEDADAHGASLYLRGQHLLSFFNGEMTAGDQDLVVRFKDAERGYVGIQLAEPSRAWLPLSVPSSWGRGGVSSGQSGVVPSARPVPPPVATATPAPTADIWEVSTPAPVAPAAPVPPTVPAANFDASPFQLAELVPPTEVPVEVKAPVAPTPVSPAQAAPPAPQAPAVAPLTPFEVSGQDDKDDFGSNQEAEEDLSNSLWESGNFTNNEVGLQDFPSASDPFAPSILSQDDITAESESRAFNKRQEQAANETLGKALHLFMVKIGGIVRREMPDYAATDIIDMLNDMARQGATLEAAIQAVRHYRKHGVPQSQLDGLVQKWIDSLTPVSN